MSTPVSVVFPSYNDARTLLAVVKELTIILDRSGRAYEIVIIDDESHDGTIQILKQLTKTYPRIRVFYHKKNQGIARVYRELYRRARNPIVVLFSVDGEWDPADVRRLIHKLEEDDLDMVIGWRKHKAYRLGRKVVSTVYNYLVRLLFGVPSYDAGSIKAMRKKVTEVSIISHGVFDEAERIIRAERLGYRIGVLPIRHKQVGHKRRFLPRPILIGQAIIDTFRVWWSLRVIGEP